MTKRTLYICYFGIGEPLVQTQVLPYLREIAKDGVEVSLLTFEPQEWTAADVESERDALSEKGIDWHFLKYHKQFSIIATSYDILKGAAFIRRFSRQNNVRLLHARSHIPLAMALLANRFLRLPLIFDLRGLMAEEYADAGVWNEGSLAFRAVKRLERRGLKGADHVVVLTEGMKKFLVEKKMRLAESISVIPCCVDLSRQDSDGSEKNDRFELIYAGSVTGLYLLEEMAGFFKILSERKPDAFFRILTKSDHENVREVFTRIGIDSESFAVERVEPREVLNTLSRAHLAISFRKPTFSQIAASPTKIPEYLACGLPVVANGGVGDTTEIIEKDRVGVVVREFTPEAHGRALDELDVLMANLPGLQAKCKESARHRFDLETIGGVRYRKIYSQLLGRH